MRFPKFLALVFCVGMVSLASSLKADEWDKETKVNFSGPVQVENTSLPAGTYVFKLADTADRHVVQIFNEDQTRIIATILAIPDYRIEPTGKTVVRFSESGGGSEVTGSLPETGLPIKEWFYPGDNAGSEFRVVPQPQVAAAQPAPAAAPQPAPAPPAPVAAAPAPAAPQPAEPLASAAQPQPEPQTQPQAQQPASAPEQNQLPQTASQMPLVALVGIVSLAIAGGLRIFAKRSA